MVPTSNSSGNAGNDEIQFTNATLFTNKEGVHSYCYGESVVAIAHDRNARAAVSVVGAPLTPEVATHHVAADAHAHEHIHLR